MLVISLSVNNRVKKYKTYEELLRKIYHLPDDGHLRLKSPTGVYWLDWVLFEDGKAIAQFPTFVKMEKMLKEFENYHPQRKYKYALYPERTYFINGCDHSETKQVYSHSDWHKRMIELGFFE